MTKQKNNWPAYSVVKKPLSWLQGFPMNPKDHPDRQIKALRAAINKWGWTIPILAAENGIIIAGHARVLAAALKPALKDVPVIIASGWTDAQRRAYRIADNRLGELGSWSDDRLRAEFADLRLAGFDLTLTGFDMPAIDLLLGSVAQLTKLPDLPTGDKSPFEQITFTLHTSQVKDVRAAMKAADAMGNYGGSLNDNKNGNAITRVAREFLKTRKKKRTKQ
jgi:ParB-like chromosome segregation protein Spo0J